MRGVVAAGEQAPDLSGPVTVTATWLDGSEHRFNVSGLDVMAVALKQATAVGDVYHLKNIADFEGKYVRGLLVSPWAAGRRQRPCGTIRAWSLILTGLGQGVDFRIAVSGMDVRLVK